MNPLLVPFLVSTLLALAAYLAHQVMNQLHRRLLNLELAGRDYGSLSELERQALIEHVNLKFSQTIGGTLASFVLMYAYPTLFIGERMFRRNQWSSIEVIGGSALFYFAAMLLVGLTTQRFAGF
ncbi:hypothetical protein [Meiothermus granaticius]|uniref:Uncharacterized protein n=1 Tax=Meiothermus granaticius NBRC 107808 TaxID=1227551 RepID=A0A399F4J6_9DEIN|nr:hypothetical protein [Meiothermus granaticius]MCL6528338.1 hypothetical protein [Thermaceae bacterium]RIH91614.1 hypothetical protein Mgrana_02495 [Meiothermus granaticius NBRC 107808]GEM88224.1 hypothetical protein MGR01S_28490 [Meiothermus granaticius NBRC 107808]